MSAVATECLLASPCVAGPAGERGLPGRAGSPCAAAEGGAGSLQGPHEQREHSGTHVACSRTLLVNTGLRLVTAARSVCLRGCRVANLLNSPESNYIVQDV